MPVQSAYKPSADLLIFDLTCGHFFLFQSKIQNQQSSFVNLFLFPTSDLWLLLRISSRHPSAIPLIPGCSNHPPGMRSSATSQPKPAGGALPPSPASHFLHFNVRCLAFDVRCSSARPACTGSGMEDRGSRMSGSLIIPLSNQQSSIVNPPLFTLAFDVRSLNPQYPCAA